MSDAPTRLLELHARLRDCRRCPQMIGPVVHGRPIGSSILLIGQAPGPHEGKFGRPFAWTAGKTMFRWFESVGVDEERFRSAVYMAAVARCFPGKAKGGGDRKPDPGEIAGCRSWLEEEVAILKPELLLPVGTLAIEQVLGRKSPLAEVVGGVLTVSYLGHRTEAVCLPHPSGASTWHRTSPGKELLEKALRTLGAHPTWRKAFGPPARSPAGRRRGERAV